MYKSSKNELYDVYFTVQLCTCRVHGRALSLFENMNITICTGWAALAVLKITLLLGFFIGKTNLKSNIL